MEPKLKRCRLCNRKLRGKQRQYCCPEHRYECKLRRNRVPPASWRQRPNGKHCIYCQESRAKKPNPLVGGQRDCCGAKACLARQKSAQEQARRRIPKYRRKWQAYHRAWKRRDRAAGGREKQRQEERYAEGTTWNQRHPKEASKGKRDAQRRKRQREREIQSGVPEWAVSEPRRDNRGRPILDWGRYSNPESTDHPDHPEAEAEAEAEAADST